MRAARTGWKVRVSGLCSATAVLCAASAALGVDVCNPTLPYTMPDHDQRRTAASGIVGLQNGGTQYCVPTCTTDILTYLQNHGYPALGMGPGPGPWLGTPAIYNAFGTDIESLAGLMNTDPMGGTGGDNAFAGVTQWIDNAGYTGDIVVTMVGMTANNAPELGDLAFCLIARCPVTISVGWYENMGANVYVRRGGHCVAVSRLPDFCSPFPKISIRDPGSSVGSDAFSQAAGTTETYNVQNIFIIRRKASDNSLVYQGSAVRIASYGASNRVAIIDGYRAYFPALGLSACNNPVNGSCVQQHLPNPSFTGAPQTTHFNLPARLVRDLDIASDGLTSWVLQNDVDASDYVLWRKNFGSSAAQATFPSMVPFNPRLMCTGRDPRVLFFLDTNPNLLVRLNTATGVATPMSLANAATAICFDDERDEVVVFSSASRTVTRLDPTTLVPGAPRMLPSSVVVGTEPRISICPVGSYLWLTSGVQTGYGLVNASTTMMGVAATISSPAGLRGVDNDDRGHVFSTAGGQTVEFKEPVPPVPGGPWMAVSGGKFSALAEGPLFRIGRSRVNYDRLLHSSEEEMLHVLPEITATGVVDCPPDFDFSGTLGVQDIFAFLIAWFAYDLQADFDGNGIIAVQDIFAFLTAWFAGCS